MSTVLTEVVCLRPKLSHISQRGQNAGWEIQFQVTFNNKIFNPSTVKFLRLIGGMWLAFCHDPDQREVLALSVPA